MPIVKTGFALMDPHEWGRFLSPFTISFQYWKYIKDEECPSLVKNSIKLAKAFQSFEPLIGYHSLVGWFLLEECRNGSKKLVWVEKLDAIVKGDVYGTIFSIEAQKPGDPTAYTTIFCETASMVLRSLNDMLKPFPHVPIVPLSQEEFDILMKMLRGDAFAIRNNAIHITPKPSIFHR